MSSDPLSLYAPLICAYVWGSLATWFVDPAWVGVGICSWSVVIFYCLSLYHRNSVREQVSHAVDLLFEYSKGYKAVLSQTLEQADKWYDQKKGRRKGQRGAAGS